MKHSSKSDERNATVVQLLNRLFDEISNENYIADSDIEQSIDILFRTTIWGFREVVLVVAIARLIEPSYCASEDFYACNPRTLFEKPIKQVLDSKGIPSRQSGPLNVAKGTPRLNTQWAAGRKPRFVAEEVVQLVAKIEQISPQDLENFTKLLLRRFIAEALQVRKSMLFVDPKSDLDLLFRLTKSFIENTPDQGNTPQRIIGYLLESYHDQLASNVTVHGHTDHASTTSTTSKKLGDITEESNGVMLLVYEVTVKGFGEQRIREAYASILQYAANSGLEAKEIIVLCREQDVHPDVVPVTSLYLGKLEYEGVVFYFLDIYEWIIAQLFRMSMASRRDFFDKLQSYVADKNTSEKLRYAWKAMFREDSA
ncbi:MAG: hypothetical protein AB4911_17220 [Oscillochloridaceae bacterium umkhey_bin13]